MQAASVDFSKGKVWRHILNLAVPLMIAQLVSLAYNLVDRIYIGHLPGASSLAITGLGLTFPVVTIIAAFMALYSTGATPLFSIARGEGNEERAVFLLNTTFGLLIITALCIMVIAYLFMEPILFAFGASKASWPYARDYLMIYLIGTPLVMLASGMNGFISAQGFARTSMVSTIAGAVCNMILDPIFIFALHMGIQGAALATVLSQLVSTLWVCGFLASNRSAYRLHPKHIRFDWHVTLEIWQLGAAGFVMQGSNFAVQIACNVTLRTHGGDLYVGVMTLLNSVREMCVLPVMGLTNGSQPVLGYNYGARQYDRIKSGIRFITLVSVLYTGLAWALVLVFSRFILSLFTNDGAMIQAAIPSLRIYFFGFIFMALQFAGQSTFTGLGQAKQAIFFSIFRKIIIVVPLTLWLPTFIGVQGVFVAEPISNLIGGSACYLTMLAVMKKLLAKKPVQPV